MRETSHIKYFFTLTETYLVSQTTRTPNSAPIGLEKEWIVKKTELMVPLKCLSSFLTRICKHRYFIQRKFILECR